MVLSPSAKWKQHLGAVVAATSIANQRQHKQVKEAMAKVVVLASIKLKINQRVGAGLLELEFD